LRQKYLGVPCDLPQRFEDRTFSPIQTQSLRSPSPSNIFELKLLQLKLSILRRQFIP
jgi:hypothetical protein